MQANVRCLRLVTFHLFVLALCTSCGGQQGSPKTASAGGESGSNPQGGQSSGPQLPSCDDGTCFACGDGICPTGFYCDTNKGVTGCAWIPSCVKTPSCDCLKPTLPRDQGCKCEDRKGVAFVTCGAS